MDRVAFVIRDEGPFHWHCQRRMDAESIKKREGGFIATAYDWQSVLLKPLDDM